jgi:hypothetical protein
LLHWHRLGEYGVLIAYGNEQHLGHPVIFQGVDNAGQGSREESVVVVPKNSVICQVPGSNYLRTQQTRGDAKILITLISVNEINTPILGGESFDQTASLRILAIMHDDESPHAIVLPQNPPDEPRQEGCPPIRRRDDSYPELIGR